MNLLFAADTSYQKINVGDLKFYFIVAALLVVVCIALFIFSKTQGFKMRKRKKIIEDMDEYESPHIIKVKRSDIDEEISETNTKGGS